MPSILVVDDDILVLKTLEKALKINGYDVDTADSAYKAFQMTERSHYDTVLVDIRMPIMDGIELMDKVNGPKRLLMTGYTKKYLDCGYRFLQKPFGIDELLKYVENENDYQSFRSN